MRRKNRFRWGLVIIAIIFSLYYLYPTIRFETMGFEKREELLLQGELKDMQKKVIKRGLDLQGGMYLVLEVDLINLFETLAKNKDEKFDIFLENLKKEESENPNENFYDILDRLVKKEKINLIRYYEINRRGYNNINEYLHTKTFLLN